MCRERPRNSARKPARSHLAHARDARAFSSTHGVADSGPPLLASSSSFGRPNQRRDRAIHATSAPRDSLVAFSTPWRTSGHLFHPSSPILAPVATDMADGRLGRANAGRSKRVEREVNGVTASVAHRDFNEARSSSEEARSEAGHGGGACGGTPAGVGEERLGLELR